MDKCIKNYIKLLINYPMHLISYLLANVSCISRSPRTQDHCREYICLPDVRGKYMAYRSENRNWDLLE